MWGSGPDDVFVVGYDGTVLRYNGSEWQDMSNDEWFALYDVWGSGPDDVFAVGWDGTRPLREVSELF